MAIHINANRAQFRSAAKNGTLGAQGTLLSDQILFDTNMTINNGDVDATPDFKKRLVILRRGQVDQEINYIQTEELDGLTCNCKFNWKSAPVSGDTYHITYDLKDLVTTVACSKDATTKEYIMDRRLEVGRNATEQGMFALTRHRTLRFPDTGTSPALIIEEGSSYHVGAIKNLKMSKGGTMIFTHIVDGQTCMRVKTGAYAYMYDYSMVGTEAQDGIEPVMVVQTGGILQWADGLVQGVVTPMTKARVQLKSLDGAYWGTVGEIKANMSSLNGWCTGDSDEALLDAMAGRPDSEKLYLLFEGG